MFFLLFYYKRFYIKMKLFHSITQALFLINKALTFNYLLKKIKNTWRYPKKYSLNNTNGENKQNQ
jgi:hypothetical protein